MNYSNFERDERWNRLSSAILQQSVKDFRKYAHKNHLAIVRHNKSKAASSAGELRKIVAFIMSDWFKYLTSYNCPQRECVMKLMEEVDKSQWEFILKDYVSI